MRRACPSCREAVLPGALLCAACGAKVAGARMAINARFVLGLLGMVLAGIASVVAAWVFIARPVVARLTPDPVRAALRAQAGLLELSAYDDVGDEVGLGSGFLVADSGLALTNFHVVAGATRLEATLADGRLFDVVSIESYDPDRDVCAFRIARVWNDTAEPPARVTPLPLRQRGAARVGERIAVIGSPKGYQNTVSDGLVSGMRAEDGLDYLQFTAPISGGSSGGPVVDGHGRVVGMVVMTKVGAQNLNFAIPVRSLVPHARTRLGWSVVDLRDSLRALAAAECAAGDSLVGAKDESEALARFRHALDLDPFHLPAMHRLAIHLHGRGDDLASAGYLRDYLTYSRADDPWRAQAKAMLQRLRGLAESTKP